MTHKDEFEELLHEALSEYRDAEPLAGLESRVLRRLGSQRQERKQLWLRWGTLAACAAALVFATWIGVKTRSPRPEAAARDVTVRPSGAPMPQAPVPPSREPHVKARASEHLEMLAHGPNAAIAVVAPRRSNGWSQQFPVPVPLTQEEQALMTALDRHPEALRTSPEPDLAVVIAEIEIRPLSNTHDPGEDQ